MSGLQIKNPNCASTDYNRMTISSPFLSGDLLTSLNGDLYGMPHDTDGRISSKSANAWYIYETIDGTAPDAADEDPGGIRNTRPASLLLPRHGSGNPAISPDAYAYSGSDNFFTTVA